MEVWPPPPTHNAEPPPPEGAPRRRLLTKHRWLDVLLGVLAGLVSWPFLWMLSAFVFGLLQAPVEAKHLRNLMGWCVLGLVALGYGLLYRMRPAFARPAIAVTFSLWFPILLVGTLSNDH